MYSTRQYIIFPVTEIPKIDFNEVLETSQYTLRRSVDQTKTFVKWPGEQPTCIDSLLNTEGPYTYEEIIAIMSTPEWTPSISDIL